MKKYPTAYHCLKVDNATVNYIFPNAHDIEKKVSLFKLKNDFVACRKYKFLIICIFKFLLYLLSFFFEWNS